jgi:2-polyprenyl-3-methyl-5-hydroxy-6-metoxy-1,4-benzoquinol methylase
MPARESLAEFYPAQYWWSEKSGANRGARLFSRLERLHRETVVKDHARFVNECARRHPRNGRLLLDIGCGNGTFLKAVRSLGFTPHGMDASGLAVEIARKESGCPVRQGEIGSGVWDGYRFDYVTMFHVLEHHPDPRLTLRYVGELLRPGGVLVVQVPNVSSIQARVFSARWYGLDVPRHLINYTPEGLALLLEEAGFYAQITTRFSLRDNPASIASSLVPCLDPVHRKGMGLDSSALLGGIAEAAYFGLFLLSIPAALLESACGAGGTVWACGVAPQ